MSKKLRSRRWLLSIFLSVFLLMGGNITAQSGKGKIVGKVTDKSIDEVLLGANVYIPELQTGSSTDIDGKYLIEKLPEGTYEIVVRFVGYKTFTTKVIVSANRVTELDIALSPSAVQMDELVVSGQGTAIERRKLSSNVETIRADEIKNSPVESVDQLLQGRVAGLAAFNSSGMPGTGGRVSTRGIKSTVTSSTPIVYVDNVKVDNGDAFRLALDTGGAESSALADLVVGQVDHIEVIKGGAASTMYGSEAANGVIQIFTKKGMPGAPRFSLKTTQGFDIPEYQFIKEQYVKDNVMQTSSYQGYETSLSGGTVNFTYNVSGKMYKNTGIIVDDLNDIKNYSFAAGTRVHLAEKMNIEISSSYVKNQFDRIYNNNAFVSPFGGFEDGSHGDQLGYTDELRDADLEIMKLAKINDDVDRFFMAANFDHELIDDLTYRVTFGLDYRKNEERSFVPKTAGDLFGVVNGDLERADREYLTLTMELNSTYKVPQLFGFVDQNITGGMQGFRVEDRQEYAYGEGFGIPGTEDFDDASLIDAQESNRQLFSGGFYLMDQVGFWDKLFFDMGFRVDVNSTFGDDIGFQFYPKVGVAYNISREDFYPALLKSVMPTLKLRSSWGVTGNFPAPFTRDRTYTANSFNESTGISFGNPGNDNIKPEKTESWEVGFDAGMFNDRLSVELNYYIQTTNDALFSVPQDVASGFTSQLENVGTIENKGLEFSIFSRILQMEDISISSRLSYSTLENKVVSLGGAAPFDLASFSFLPRRVVEGYPVGVFQVRTPVADADGNFTGDYEEQLIGNALPKQFGSFSLSINLFKNISINGLMEYAFGHNFVNLKKTLRYFSGTEDAKDAVPENYTWETASNSWFEDADWVKIREISVVYRMPKLLFNGVTFSMAIRNVATFGVTASADPELNGYQPNGADTGGYGVIDYSAPRQFRFSVGLNL